MNKIVFIFSLFFVNLPMAYGQTELPYCGYWLSNANDPLLNAACNRDLEKIKKLVKGGANVNTTYPNGIHSKLELNALGWALMASPQEGEGENKLIEIFDYFVSEGAKLNGFRFHDSQRDRVVHYFPLQSFSAFGLAAYRGHTKLLNHMIKNGADVNEVYFQNFGFNHGKELYKSWKYNPLSMAVVGNQSEAVKILVSNGARILYPEKPHKNTHDGKVSWRYHQSLLDFAIRSRNSETIEILLNTGHRVTENDLIASIEGFLSEPDRQELIIEEIKYLIKFNGKAFYQFKYPIMKAPLSNPGQHHIYAKNTLELAIWKRMPKVADFILSSQNIDPLLLGRAFTLSFVRGAYQLAEKMLSIEGVDFNYRLEHGNYIIVSNGYWPVYNISPMIFSIARRKISFIEALISKGVKLNEKTGICNFDKGYGNEMSLLSIAENCGEVIFMTNDCRNYHMPILEYNCEGSDIANLLTKHGAK